MVALLAGDSGRGAAMDAVAFWPPVAGADPVGCDGLGDEQPNDAAAARTHTAQAYFIGTQCRRYAVRPGAHRFIESSSTTLAPDTGRRGSARATRRLTGPQLYRVA